MEIVDVCIFLFLALSLSHTHIKCAHPHITDISFRSLFKLPRILGEHCQDPILLFLLISCVYRVSGCPHSTLPSLLHTSASLWLPSPPSASRNRQVVTPGLPWSPCCTAPTDQGRTAWHTPATRLPPLPALAANQTHLLPTVTRSSENQPGSSACQFNVVQMPHGHDFN